MDNQQVTEFEFGWISGIIDGEGCFTISEKRSKRWITYVPLIEMTNTDFELVDKFSNILKRLDIAHFVYLSERTKCNDAKSLRIFGLKRIQKFFKILKSRLMCKADVADAVCEFVESRLSKPVNSPYSDRELFLQSYVKDCNSRKKRPSGTSETTRDRSFFEGL